MKIPIPHNSPKYMTKQFSFKFCRQKLPTQSLYLHLVPIYSYFLHFQPFSPNPPTKSKTKMCTTSHDIQARFEMRSAQKNIRISLMLHTLSQHIQKLKSSYQFSTMIFNLLFLSSTPFVPHQY